MQMALTVSGKGIDAMKLVDAPIPVPGPGEALLRMRAATLNFRDLIMAKGLIPGIAKEPEVVPLSCGAGEVVAVGSGVTRVKAGDRVTPIFALGRITADQASADMLGGSVDGVGRQYACFPAESLCHIPDQIGDLEAATFACAALTSWSALTQYRHVQPGDWILAHGTGGVAIAALQFAKAIGANVIITSSSDAKLARARALGADVAINYRTTPDWPAAVRAAIGGNRVSNVVDTVGEVQFDRNASLLVDEGQISSIGMLGSDFSWTLQNPGVSMVPISVGNRDQHEAMVAFTAAHNLRPVVDVLYDLSRIQDAYRHLESGNFFGKVGINLL